MGSDGGDGGSRGGFMLIMDERMKLDFRYTKVVAFELILNHYSGFLRVFTADCILISIYKYCSFYRFIQL